MRAVPTAIGWPTRKQVADVLGVSSTTVRRMEDAGELTPQKDEAGTNRFNPSEVERVRQQRLTQGDTNASVSRALTSTSLDGELAATIFEDLDLGMTPIDIVRQRQLAPQLVASAVQAHRQLSELAGQTPSSEQQLARIEQFVGSLGPYVQRLEQRLESLELYLGMTRVGG